MANIPTKLFIYTEDKVNFPVETVLTLMGKLFVYGLREIYVGGDDKVIISLKYRPKDTTLSKKFGSLPIRYLLFTKKIDQESFGILEGLIRQYKFNCAN